MHQHLCLLAPIPCILLILAAALKRHLSDKKNAADDAAAGAAEAEPAAAAASALRPKTPTPGEGVRGCQLCALVLDQFRELS
jgi:hypothetical protein